MPSPPPLSPPPRLSSFASYIASGARLSLLFGAGVSTACGVPDFRSPGGLYATLRPELLTATAEERARMAADATAVVEKSLFLKNPLPYHELRRPFILGTFERRWRGTLAHAFARALSARGQLRHVFSQNIDGLERLFAFPAGEVVSVHGSVATAACEACGAAADQAAYIAAVRAQIRNIYDPADGPAASTPIACASCRAPAVKPATVLFGGQLPDAFFTALAADFAGAADGADGAAGADLLLVAGTSLRVFPAASIVPAAAGLPRLVINREPVGDEIGFDPAANETDCFFAADTDAGFLELAKLCGMVDEMKAYMPVLCDASRALLE